MLPAARGRAVGVVGALVVVAFVGLVSFAALDRRSGSSDDGGESVESFDDAPRGSNGNRASAGGSGVPVAMHDRDTATFARVEQARVATGIRLPDGTCLPPLNDVRVSDPIPAVEREAYMPPIGDVVGRYTDGEGYDWWVTSDGSAFTTRWVTVRMDDGTMARVVRLDQSDSLADDGFALPPPLDLLFPRDESK